MPKVSVVIPCYNQGEYLDEAVASVLAQTFRDFEIIVVNDGSTDEFTNRLLAGYDRPKTSVLRTPNRGLAAARNSGIAAARGEYILPLDADDMIAPTYLEKGVAVLDKRGEVGIVYCLAEKFGAEQGPWFAAEFSPRRMLLGNLIFCSALFRKSDWERSGGYNTGMERGWEDWDFWLSLIERGVKVHRLPEVLFRYRVKERSMAKGMDAAIKAEMHRQIYRNHRALYPWNIVPFLGLYYRITGSRPYRLLKKLGAPRLFSGQMGRKG